jgi:hypothetical protein
MDKIGNLLYSAVSKTDVNLKETAVDVQESTLQTKIIFDDRILAGLLSFVAQWESTQPPVAFFKSEGGLRRPVTEAGKSIFPGMDLEHILGSLQVLGLFQVKGDRFIHDKKLFEDFSMLSPRERMEYCTAALLVYDEVKKSEILPPLLKGRIKEITNFIHGLLDNLDDDFFYTEKTLNRVAEVLMARAGADININLMFKALEKTGLVTEVTKELKQLANWKEEKQQNPSIAIDSGFSVFVYPEINFSDAVYLASFLNIKEAGAVVRFELEKDSAVRAFNNKKNADEIIDLLMRLSGGRLEESFIWNLKEWEKRHGEVSIKKGIVLTITEDKSYIVKTLPSEMIIETLAPGMYLLNENAADHISTALSKAGIDIVARHTYEKKNFAISYNQFSSLTSVPVIDIKLSQYPQVKASFKSDYAAELISELSTVLKKIPLAETEKAELSARIQRRLVLCETQLKDASLRYEKLEARHMDYMGKQNVARRAIAQHSPVEIVWPSAGEEKRIFGIPKALEKKEKDLIFVVIPAGEEEPLRIPLAKVSLLRRIKKSIFEN